MAIQYFVPEIWAGALLANLRDALVYGQAGVINRDYEGHIARAGDTVHITNFVDPQVRKYSKNAGHTDSGETPVSAITYDLLTDDTRKLEINQADYFAFQVDDIDNRQALPGFVEETTRGAAYNLAAEADSFLADTMIDAVDGTANDLGAVSLSPQDAYELLVDLRTVLTRSKTPAQGRWVVVPPEFYALLLKDERFIRADAAGTTSGLRNALVGRAAGFDVIESNTVPEEDGAFRVLAGHGMATTYAEQIASTEALRLESGFADAIRGLHLYGAKVIRPAQLALADVTVESES